MKCKSLHILSLVLLAALCMPSIAHAQFFKADTLSVNVFFRQGDYRVDEGFRDNKRSIDTFVTGINEYLNDQTRMIYTINVSSLASPEGNEQVNDRLAISRAKALRDVILDRTTLSPFQVRAVPVGTNWAGLREAVVACNESWKDSVLSIIDSTPRSVPANGKTYDSRTLELQKLNDGAVWEYLLTNIFPSLRHASASVSCLLTKEEALDVYEGRRHYRDTLVISHKDTLYIINEYYHRIRPEKEKKEHVYKHQESFRTPVMAFRSNLLVPLSNIGIEVPVNNRWSIEADYYSPWIFRPWMNKVTPYYQNCFQVQGVYLNARVWLGKKHSAKDGDSRYRLVGHSIGFGPGAAIYDIGFNYKGQQGNIIAFGVDYTYVHPVGKGGVRFEFTIGACAYYNYHRNYSVDNSDKLYGDGPWYHTFSVAPFKAGISLVVPIFKKKEVRYENE